MLWESISDSLSEEEKAEWNKWRKSVWENTQDLQIATGGCNHGSCGERGSEVLDLSHRLREVVSEIPVFNVNEK